MIGSIAVWKLIVKREQDFLSEITEVATISDFECFVVIFVVFVVVIAIKTIFGLIEWR
jgi:hypothetical protein